MTACSSSSTPKVTTPTASQAAPSAPTTPAATPSDVPSETPTTTPSQTPSETPATTPSQTPSNSTGSDKNAVVGAAKKFRVTLPAGWKDLSDKFTGTKMVQLAIAAPQSEHGTLTNINVVSIDAPPGTDIKAAVASGAKNWKAKGATVSNVPPRTVAGEKAYGYTMLEKESKAAITQYYFAHKTAIYVVTLTANKDSAPSANKGLDEFIQGWAWM